MLFFTADWHLNHSNIIKLCNRPYSSVDEMNQALIDNFNKVVSSKDTTYFIGDICFAKEQFLSVIPKLNGIKYFAEGNHDKWWQSRSEFNLENVYFIPKEFALHSKKNNKLLIILNHYPMRAWDAAHYGAYHLYGHVHNRLPNFGYSMDVGVDAQNYFPISLDEVVETFRPLKEKNQLPYSVYDFKYNTFS